MCATVMTEPTRLMTDTAVRTAMMSGRRHALSFWGGTARPVTLSVDLRPERTDARIPDRLSWCLEAFGAFC